MTRPRNFESGAVNSSTEFLFVTTLTVNFDREYRGAIARQQPLHRCHWSQRDYPNDGRRHAKADLAAANAKPCHGRKPQCRRRGHPDDDVITTQDGSATDKSDPGQYAKWQPHQIVHHKGIGRPTGRRQQQIDLDHGDGGGDAHQHAGSQSGGLPVLTAIESEREPDEHAEPQPQSGGRSESDHSPSIRSI